MRQDAAVEMARQLLSALYANPQHGPAVAAHLPSGDMMPNSNLALIYDEMLKSGLASARLDYARLDHGARRYGGFEAVTDPVAFSLGERRHADEAEMLSTWSRQIANRHRNVKFSRDLEMLSKALPDSDATTEEAVARVVERAKSYIEEAQGLEHISKGIERALERIADWKDGKSSDYLLTGWGSVDGALGGWPIGEMSVMAGMTSGFKTASLVDMTRRMGLRFEQREEPVAIIGFSAEMSHEKLCHRLAANLSGVPSSLMRPDRTGKRQATPMQEEKYEAALMRARSWHVFVNESPNPSYEQMYSQCLQVQTRMPLALVWFDYLEKMDEDGASEELRVSAIAQRLKALAKRIEVPVVTLSQYSRSAESSNGGLPKNFWLRYSGKIEQEANTIIHWHFPKYFIDRKADPSAVEYWNEMEPHAIYAICGKNRDGEVRDVKLYVDPPTGRFMDPIDNRY